MHEKPNRSTNKLEIHVRKKYMIAHFCPLDITLFTIHRYYIARSCTLAARGHKNR